MAFAHGVLLRRTVPPAPTVTRMVFWNEVFNQWVVQEVTMSAGDLSYVVADNGSTYSLSRLLPVLLAADLIVVVSAGRTGPLSTSSLMGYPSNGLQRIPHVLVVLHEVTAKPSPADVFSAHVHLARLPQVAILYQATHSRVVLGPCHAVHISGCLGTLWGRGEFHGWYVHRNVNWPDLPLVTLETAFEQLVTVRASSGPTSRLPPTGILGSTALGVPLSLSRRQLSTSAVNDNLEGLGAGVSRLSTFRTSTPEFTAAPTLTRTMDRLRDQIRAAHRRNSRALSDICATYQRAMYQSILAPSTSFRGECQVCCEEDSQLALLFKQSLSPLPSLRSLWCPFAVGAEPENDIISAFMCCDNCAVYIVEQGDTPFREPCTGALSLRAYSTHSEQWKVDLAKGFGHYGSIAKNILPIVLLAVVDNTLRTKSWAQVDGSEENNKRRAALEWVESRILEAVYFTREGHSGYLDSWISSEVRDSESPGSLVYRCSPQAFSLLLRLAGDGVDTKKVMWRRLLSEITEHLRVLLSDKEQFAHSVERMMAINHTLPLTVIGGEVERLLLAQGVLSQELLNVFKDQGWGVEPWRRHLLVRWIAYIPTLYDNTRGRTEAICMVRDGVDGVW
jgi:hypothetical protein